MATLLTRLTRSPLAAATAVTLAAAITACPNFTWAQEQARLEEVVVVARKTQENLQEVPLTISVLGEEEIDRLGITTTEDVINYNPGLTLTQGIGGDDIRPDIRGVTSLSGRANVAILVDGVDQTSDALTGAGAGQLISLGLFDLERVEVVRGPQSALYGRNAFGGAINYITKRPSDTFEARVGVDAGSEDLIKANLSLTGPVSENLAYRINVTHKEVDGQYDHPVTGKNLGNEESDAISGSLEWIATDQLSILARVDYAEQEIGERAILVNPYNACTRVDRSGNEIRTEGACQYIPFMQSPTSIGELPATDARNIRLSEEGTNGVSNDLFNFTLQARWEGDDVSVLSNTAFTRHEGNNNYDLDHQETVTRLPTWNPPGSPPFVQVPGLGAITFPWVSANNPFQYVYDADNERDVFFQDFRISFRSGDNLDWLLGGEYYYEDYGQDDYLRANGAIDRNNLTTSASVTTALWLDVTDMSGGRPATDQVDEVRELTGTLPRKAERETEALGFYAAMNWQFRPDWELSLSARYQEEDVDIEYTVIDATYPTPMFDRDKPGVFYASIPNRGFCPGVASPNGQLCAVAPPSPLATGPGRVHGSESFSNFNTRASLTWHSGEDHIFYGSVAQGSKPGGFNFEALLVPANVVYDQEELTTWELGWKGQWRDDRVLFNGTVYYNKNKDKQASANQPAMDGNPPVPYVENIGDADSWGIELTNTLLVTDNLRLNWSYSYIDAEYDNFIRTRSDGASTVDLSGQEMPRSPEHSALVSIQYNLPTSNGEFYFRSDVIYRDEMYADDLGWTILPELTTVNVQVGWIAESWEIIGYVNNVTDEDELISAVGFVDFRQQFQNMYTGTPAIQRHGGVRLRYRF